MSLFSNFVAGFWKVVKADDGELVDPQKVLRVSYPSTMFQNIT